jgi:hypothetical protein
MEERQDSISKQAVIDEIEERKNANRYRNVAVISELNRLEGYIMRLPSAQPEIIYCGECAKMKVDTVFHDCWCGETGKKVWANHYCGYAERRTDE